MVQAPNNMKVKIISSSIGDPDRENQSTKCFNDISRPYELSWFARNTRSISGAVSVGTIASVSRVDITETDSRHDSSQLMQPL